MALVGTDLIVIERGGVLYKATLSDLAAFVGGGGGATITVFTDQATFDTYSPATGEIAVLDGDGIEIGYGGQYFFQLPTSTILDASVNALAATTVAGAALRCDLTPFCPAHNLNIDQLLCEVTTLQASSTALLGIYSDLDGVPDAKLVESASLDCSTTGVKSTTLGSVFTMQKGQRYWWACATSGTQTLRALAVGGMMALGLSTTAGVRANIRRATLASMALPATMIATTLTGATTPQFRVRVAA
jgi:hypothetical protein